MIAVCTPQGANFERTRTESGDVSKLPKRRGEVSSKAYLSQELGILCRDICFGRGERAEPFEVRLDVVLGHDGRWMVIHGVFVTASKIAQRWCEVMLWSKVKVEKRASIAFGQSVRSNANGPRCA